MAHFNGHVPFRFAIVGAVTLAPRASLAAPPDAPVDAPQAYAAEATQFTSMLGIYVAPKVALGFKLAERLHLPTRVGALVVLVPAGQVPTWIENDSKMDAGTSGLAMFGADALICDVTVFLSPRLRGDTSFERKRR